MTSSTPAVASAPSRNIHPPRGLPVISLLLLAAIIALWVRTYGRCDVVIICLNRGLAQGVISRRGQFALFCSNIPLGPEREWTLIHSSQEPEFGEASPKDLSDDIAWSKGKGGFSIGESVTNAFNLTQNGRFRFITAPIWILLILPLVPIALYIRKAIRRRSRIRRGLCLMCGYDLRGSQVRCPECGRPFMAASAVAPNG